MNFKLVNAVFISLFVIAYHLDSESWSYAGLIACWCIALVIKICDYEGKTWTFKPKSATYKIVDVKSLSPEELEILKDDANLSIIKPLHSNSIAYKVMK